MDPNLEKKNFIKPSEQKVDKIYHVSKDKSDILGKGSHGTVLRVVNKNTKQVRALKIIKKSGNKDENFDIERIISEFMIMRELVI